MKQLAQNYKTGKLEIEDVPIPQAAPNKLLVRAEYSLISTGTERIKIAQAKMSYLEKAKAKPQELARIIENVKQEGLIATYKKVMNKLDSLTPLGYSLSGEVIGVPEGVAHFSVGDKVACAGEEASHCEIVSVYPNLCAKIPQGISIQEAAFTTIGAIALQGVRRGRVNLQETVVVIGLGLIGQLTVQLLKASGCKVLGIDIRQSALDLAITSGADRVVLSSQDNIQQITSDISAGLGADAVIITASTQSLEPINLAGRLCRQKGRVVVVGAVPTGFSREEYYKKELDLVMSCSYGPGRYDNRYEQKGLDYPVGYARWTENRNMQAFLSLIAEGKIKLGHITSRIFKFDQAIAAYELLNSSKNEELIGILLEYDSDKDIAKDITLVNKLRLRKSAVFVGMIGAGSFAGRYLLPCLKKVPYTDLTAVVTASGLSAKDTARKFGFRQAVSEANTIFEDKGINLVMIATRHSLHAEYVIKALKSGKNVFVEKPLCLNTEELSDIIEAYNASEQTLLFVGFNRRFAPLAVKVKQFFANIQPPLSITCRVNASSLPAGHWTRDIEEGGRIIGEVCHFIDIARYWTASPVKEVFASALSEEDNIRILPEDAHIILKFNNGSVATIQYLTSAASAIPKEYYEVSAGGRQTILNDFKSLLLAQGAKTKQIRRQQDKGHRWEMLHLVDIVKNGLEPLLSAEEIFEATRVSFAVMQSMRDNRVVKL